MYDVACIGIMVADIIAKPVDKVPEKGLLDLVDSISLFSGGNAMTASINIKKLGLNPVIIGRCGADYWGDFLESCLIKNGVDVSGLKRDNSCQTSCSVALSSADGERSFLHCTGTNAKFCIDDIDMDIVKNSKIVFVTGTYLLETFDGEQTTEFFKRCKELGKITACDVCWDSKGRWDSLIKDAIPYIDIFMPSVDEAREIAKCDDVDKMADTFFDWGAKSVVIKLGSKGCYLREHKEDIATVLPCYTGIKVVDTTGAGDSFCSGFLAALARGEDFISCGKFANATGAHNVMAQGATTGIKSYDEIKEFMKSYEA